MISLVKKVFRLIMIGVEWDVSVSHNPKPDLAWNLKTAVQSEKYFCSFPVIKGFADTTP